MVFEILVIGRFDPYGYFWQITKSVPNLLKITSMVLVIICINQMDPFLITTQNQIQLTPLIHKPQAHFTIRPTPLN